MFLFLIIPGDKSLLSLSLSIVSLLIVVVIVFEAALLPSPVPLLGPVVVVALPGTGPGPRSGPGAPPVGTSYAKTSKVSRLPKTTLSVFTFPLPVSRLGKFGPKTVRGQATVATVFAVAATGTTTRSPKTRTARISVTTRTRTIRRWHSDEIPSNWKSRGRNDARIKLFWSPRSLRPKTGNESSHMCTPKKISTTHSFRLPALVLLRGNWRFKNNQTSSDQKRLSIKLTHIKRWLWNVLWISPKNKTKSFYILKC